MKRRLGLIALAALALVGSACAGPRTPVAVGVKEFPTDVLLGTKAGNLIPLERSPIETNPVVAPPRRPRGNINAPVPTPASACPEVDPLSAPKVEATNRILAPPVERSYRFRTTGSVEVGNEKSKLAPEALRTVQNVERPSDSVFTFEVLDELGSVKTLNRYRVVQRGNLDEAVKGETGLFITETVRGDGNDPPVTYTWDPPITLLRFPIEHGDKWQVHASALDGQVVMNFSARIGKETPDTPDDVDIDPQVVDSKIRVDACGEYLDAWNVQVGVPDATGGPPGGRYAGPETLLTFTEAYAITPQYGGIVVKETRSATGDSSGEPVKSDRTSTINTIPARSTQ